MDALIVDRLERHATVAPDAPALSFGDRTWTYRSLLDTVEGLAAGLVGRGLRSGDRLAVVAGNAPEVLLAWLAGARTGIVPALLSPLLTPRELAGVLERLRPALLVTDSPNRSTVVATGTAVPVVVIGSPNGAAGGFHELLVPGPCLAPAPRPDDLFEITLTSGTTSLPKLVGMTQGAECAHWDAVGRALGVSADDTTRIVTPLFHSSGVRNGAVVALLAGGHVIVSERFSASRFWADAARDRATWFTLVETMLVILLKQQPRPSDRGHGVRFVIGGGAAEVVEAFEDRFGVRVVQAYGMTECGMPVTTAPADRTEVRRLRRQRPSAALAGRPIDGCAVKVVGESGEATVGEAGEILVRSSQLLREYIDDPAATASALSDGWLRTGDIGVVDADGALYYLGRQRDVIRRGGENFSPAEVERTIESHPAVARCAVVAIPDDTYGEEAAAFVVETPDATVDAGELWEWCAARLAKFKVPRRIEFRSEMPTSSSGRVRKELLVGDVAHRTRGPFDRTPDGVAAQEGR